MEQINNSINRLSNDDIGKIAAGEVILCPGSVIKELLENAIDSGANHITINIKNQGMELIEVIDNGSGIDPHDLPNAIKRHYTSKFTGLFDINSFGFRGEGLYAINESSKMTIISNNLKLYNNKITSQSSNKGTIVRVENLFYKWPIRRSFAQGNPYRLKKLIKDIIPYVYYYQKRGIKFTLYHNNKPYNKLLFNPKSHLLFEFQETYDYLKIKGIIYSTNCINPMIFVNGRPIYNKKIQQLIKKSYNVLTGQTNFSYVVEIECPNEYVNVNIHPQKKQVQFKHNNWEHIIKDLIFRGISTKYYPNASLADIQSFQEIDMSSPQMNLPDLKKYIKNTNITYSEPNHIQQLGLRYLLYFYDDYFIIMDQHAAHERVITEQLKKEELNKITLINPITVIDYSHKTLDHLKGFVEYYRLNNTIIITAVVDFLLDVDFNILIHQDYNYILDYLHEYGCKNAIKSGTKVDKSEAKLLLKKIIDCPNGKMCNHGRPTYLSLEMDYLDKLFWRKNAPKC